MSYPNSASRYPRLAPRPLNEATQSRDAPIDTERLRRDPISPADADRGHTFYRVVLPKPYPPSQGVELECWYISSEATSQDTALQLLSETSWQNGLLASLNRLTDRLRRAGWDTGSWLAASKMVSDTMKSSVPDDFSQANCGTRTWLVQGSSHQYRRHIRDQYMHSSDDARWCFKTRLEDGQLQHAPPILWATFAPEDCSGYQNVTQANGFTAAEVEIWYAQRGSGSTNAPSQVRWQPVSAIDRAQGSPMVAENDASQESVPYTPWNDPNASGGYGDDQTGRDLPPIDTMVPELWRPGEH